MNDTTHIIQVGYPRAVLAGMYLKGPTSPQEVKRLGYAMTREKAEAWPFPNVRQASAKVKVLAKHFQMAVEEFVVLPMEGYSQA